MRIQYSDEFDHALKAFSPYTKVFIFSDGESCCERCARDNAGMIKEAIDTRNRNSTWLVVGCEDNTDYDGERCANCNEQIVQD